MNDYNNNKWNKLINWTGEKKKERLAKETLGTLHGSLYRYWHYSDKNGIVRILTIDESLRLALKELGLTEERWEKLAIKIFYIGVIRKESRDSLDYTKKKDKYLREHMITSWLDGDLKYISDTLKEALSYFGIEMSEWIKYGDTVIEMYDLQNSPDMREFGYINAIMPMKNNLHLIWQIIECNLN